MIPRCFSVIATWVCTHGVNMWVPLSKNSQMFQGRRNGPQHQPSFWSLSRSNLTSQWLQTFSIKWFILIFNGRFVWLVNHDHSTQRQLSLRLCAAFFLSTFSQPFFGSRGAFNKGCLQAKGPIEIQPFSWSHDHACLSDFRSRNTGFLMWAVMDLQTCLIPTCPWRLIPNKSLLWWVPPL